VASLTEETQLVWTKAEWRSEAERWIANRLCELGRNLAGAIEQPHVRPWGTVLRVPTDVATLWFKASISPLAYEVPLLEGLAAHAPDRAPDLLAAKRDRAWMLMADAGTRVADLFPDGPPLTTWKEFLPQYAQLQIDAAPAADELLSQGVPDRRLPRLVDGFLCVLENERLVRPRGGTGLTDDQLRRLRSLEPVLFEAIDVVAALDLPDTVQHDDLHAWNVCIDGDSYRFIDWGDACISQPLLSLYIPLAHVGDEDAAEARDAYLEPWTALRPRAALVRACDAAVLLAQLTGILKWELINSDLTDDERAGYEDVIPKRLRHLLELACG
jgi:Phosphotransferase enzyme family